MFCFGAIYRCGKSDVSQDTSHLQTTQFYWFSLRRAAMFQITLRLLSAARLLRLFDHKDRNGKVNSVRTAMIHGSQHACRLESIVGIKPEDERVRL